MSRYTFTKTRRISFDMEPGTWAPTLMDGKRTAYVCCPKCGNVGGISSHTIDDAGTVTPSIVCSSHENVGSDPCAEKGFHEFVTLEGWADVDWDADATE